MSKKTSLVGQQFDQ
jgi:hypothetical protein